MSFLWRLRGDGLDETEEVTNVMYNVSERSVAMPEGWVATFHNLDLHARAMDEAKTAEKMVDPDGIGISEVHCECLGAAKAVDDADLTCVRLRTTAGSKRNYLLCARVVGEKALVQITT